MKKQLTKLLSLAMAIILAISCLVSCGEDKNEAKYNNACTLLESGDYEAAYTAFKELGDYKDSETYLSRFVHFPTVINYDLYDRSGVITTTLGAFNLPVHVSTKGTMEGEGEYTKDGWYSYDNNGNWMRQAVLYNSDFLAYDYTYDAKGNVIKAVYSVDGTVSAVHNFTYDENGLKIRDTYEENGVVYYDYQNTYDANGNMIKSVYAAEAGNYIYEYVYNEDGKIVNERGENPAGNYYTIDYTYNDDGNLIKKVRSENGEVTLTVDCTYDSNGNRIKEERSFPDETKDIYTREYDEHGNQTKEVRTYSDGIVETAEWKYIFTYVTIDVPEWTWGEIASLFFSIF